MSLKIYNTITRTKEVFQPLNPGYVGMYVCGPTVYSDVHLGNCRTFISFDIIYRYLLHLGFKVRYVRNVTDAGHLEGDRDEGDDKFTKKAKLEQVEPMEIVQRYTVGFRDVMRHFNNLPPSIEPTATGHIVEQIEMTKQILNAGYAYEVNGTIYFDVDKYNTEQPYGILTNRKLEDLLEGTRQLGGQDEKKGRLDFALWIKAKPEHLMQWPSPWGNGFPGWHLECSAMSSKYLGNKFDIHGGGMDLAATHHTNEIAQNFACHGTTPANYWLHTNMLTVNGARMSKSAGNGFLPEELFTGNHPLLEKGYHPMVVRFFMLQTHYRSTLDFSNDALKASEIAYKRMWSSYVALQQLNDEQAETSNTAEDEYIKIQLQEMDNYMNDDFNTAKVLAVLFELNGIINAIKDGVVSMRTYSKSTLSQLKTYYKNYLENIFGLQAIHATGTQNDRFDAAMEVLIALRTNAKANKDYVTSDAIRNQLAEKGIILKDEKGGSTTWE
jgi:cysteinyl-tRNA synthetase